MPFVPCLLSVLPVGVSEADVFSYSAVISACEKCFQWALALHFFHEMWRKQVTWAARSDPLGSPPKMNGWNLKKDGFASYVFGFFKRVYSQVPAVQLPGCTGVINFPNYFSGGNSNQTNVWSIWGISLIIVHLLRWYLCLTLVVGSTGKLFLGLFSVWRLGRVKGVLKGDRVWIRDYNRPLCISYTANYHRFNGGDCTGIPPKSPEYPGLGYISGFPHTHTNQRMYIYIYMYIEKMEYDWWVLLPLRFHSERAKTPNQDVGNFRNDLRLLYFEGCWIWTVIYTILWWFKLFFCEASWRRVTLAVHIASRWVSTREFPTRPRVLNHRFTPQMAQMFKEILFERFANIFQFHKIWWNPLFLWCAPGHLGQCGSSVSHLDTLAEVPPNRISFNAAMSACEKGDPVAADISGAGKSWVFSAQWICLLLVSLPPKLLGTMYCKPLLETYKQFSGAGCLASARSADMIVFEAFLKGGRREKGMGRANSWCRIFSLEFLLFLVKRCDQNHPSNSKHAICFAKTSSLR